MSRLRHKCAAAAAIALVAFGAWLLHPFSPRFEGRTARQWLEHYSRARQLPERAVVAHFGEKAIPMLLEESRPGGLFMATLALEKVVRSRAFEDVRADDFDRRLACHDWAQSLKATHPNAFHRALMAAPDLDYGLELTRLFHGDRHAASELKRLSRQNTNVVLQARAEELLEAYRALN